MKTAISKYWKLLLTIFWGLFIFFFWRTCYPFALSYHEQFQLFLFNQTYLLDRLSEPGGMARYIAEFCVQFYNNITVGAIILSAFYMLLQRLVWLLTKRAGNGSESCGLWYLLTFIPSALLLFYMGDENVMLSFVVSLVLTLGCIAACPKEELYRRIYSFIFIPLLYWIAGPAAFMYVAFVGIKEVISSKSKFTGVGYASVYFIYVLTCILLSSFIVNYPLSSLFRGIDYYRFPDVVSLVMYVLMALCVLIPFAVLRLPVIDKAKRRAFIGISLFVAYAILVFVFVRNGYNVKTYELMEYDYLVRIQNWNGIIAKAEKHKPDLPMSVAATNLALGMTGQLGDRAFDFYQHESKGLVPPFDRNFVSSMMTGEVYFQLGLTNNAQQFAFESMEGIPNFNKSCRAVKRLAETNIINGDYAVAKKYLMLLDETVFYKKWAQRMFLLLGNEKLINADPFYGEMRKSHLTDDFLFSEIEIDKILGRLFMKNHNNKLATQYMLLCPLLNRDVNTFMQYFSIVQKYDNYNPVFCQEAVAFAYAQHQQQPPAGIVEDQVRNNFSNFVRVYTNGGKNSPEMEMFDNTCWYYLVKGK